MHMINGMQETKQGKEK